MIQFESSRGGKMRIRWKASAPPDWTSLLRANWNASLARLCQEKLAEDPFSGCGFVFRSRRGTAIRLLSYDGQGYWLARKRLSQGRFAWWPEATGPTKPLEAYEAQLLAAGDVSR